MDDQSLHNDVDIAEGIDEHLQEQSVRIEDISGSLEAIGQALVGDEEPSQLTDHQQAMVDGFKDAAKISKGAVYAVADQSALETYVDEKGVLRASKSMPGQIGEGETHHEMVADYGPNVWGTFKYSGLVLPGNEGFVEMTLGVARKAVAAFGDAIPGHFKVTSKGLFHYVEMAQRLRTRLLQLKPLLQKRDFPIEDVFDYGSYARFFQTNGKSIGSFSEFQAAMEVQSAATRHVITAIDSYTVVIMQQLLDKIQELQAEKNPDAEQLIELRDSIARHWEYVWKDAKLTPDHGQTPQAALNAFPERKFISIAPLLDNRYLVAHAPKSDGGKDPAKISVAIKHYGASVVFDKKNDTPRQQSMNVPNIDELVRLVDQTINDLNDMKGFEQLAKKNNSFAKDFKKASDVLNKLVSESSDPKFYGFVTEYFRLATAVMQVVQQPYVQMAWMYIRCAMVVTSLVELAAVEDAGKRVVAARFFTKQNEEFTNPAMESYLTTQKVLEAARRAGQS